MTRQTITNRLWWLAAALLLAGCASLDGRTLVPGQASSAEVKALMGAPALELKRPNGDTQFYYTHYPNGRRTYVAILGPDDRLRGIEQRLALPYIAKVAVGMREEEVRELFGPPREIARLPRQERNVWEYPWRFAAKEMRILWVQFSDDGVVREIIEMHDHDAEPENTWG